jgi:nicotinate phosphoribosyltransferase
MSFGVGTNLTNDAGPEPMNIVIKLSAAQPQDGEWTDVVKLSDEHGKYTGSEELIRLSKIILGIADR